MRRRREHQHQHRGGTGTTTDPTGGGGTGGTTTGGGGTGGSSSGGGGTGGTSSGGSGGGTTTGSTTTSETTTGGGDHLLISEIVVGPEGAEFIEIHNPTGAEVSLADYYLSDNSTYPSATSADPWDPVTNNPGTDFLARFPASATIPAGGYKVIATDAGFEVAYGKCPDFFLGTAALPCGGADVPALLAPKTGSVTDMSNLSNTREMVVLFTWSGNMSDLVQDVDYVTWGDTFEAGTRADKTGLTGYKPDTAPDQQKGALAPAPTQSIERCAATEVGEKETGGNGITGHDETSEDLTMSFKLAVAPTPGAKNGCPQALRTRRIRACGLVAVVAPPAGARRRRGAEHARRGGAGARSAAVGWASPRNRLDPARGSSQAGPVCPCPSASPSESMISASCAKEGWSMWTRPI